MDSLKDDRAIVHTKDNVDISECPLESERSCPIIGKQITIGDLHGNALKLMHALVREGIVTNMTPEQYKKPHEIYMTETDKLNKEKLTQFNEILSSLEFNIASSLTLLGDEFADRGMNDYFTLKILEQLKSKNVKFDIIASNHGIQWLLALEQFNLRLSIQKYSPSVNPANSMLNLQILIENKFVTEEDIATIAEGCYLPFLKLLSYSLTHSQGKPEISIYSHGKVGLNTIKDLAKQLRVNYEDKTIYELAGTIDEINRAFQGKVNDNKVGELYKLSNQETEETAFYQILWERKYFKITFPKMHYEYCLFLTHGHDKTEPSKEHILTLDNDLGKSYTDNTGQYQTHYSNNIALKDFPRHVMTCQFEQLQKKELELRNKNHTQAAECVNKLLSKIKMLEKLLTKPLTDEDISEINKAIKDARPVLATHRDWHRSLTKFFYNPPTASATILQNLQLADISKLNPPGFGR